MRLLSYNIHSCVGADGLLDINRTLEVIAASDADVVALQEVENAGHAAKSFLQAVERLGYKECIYGPTFFRRGSEYGNLLLSRYPVSAVRKLDISQRRAEPRGAISVQLDTEYGRCGLTATHLGLTAWERFRQARQLLSEIIEPQLQRLRAAILLGDLNEWFWPSPALMLLTKRLPERSRLRTFPSRFPVFRLDRVMMAGLDLGLSACVPNVPHARTASDHLPLVAEIFPITEVR